MKFFLEHIADDLLSHSSSELKQTIVIFPNRRPEQFLKSLLKKNNLGKSFVLPRMQGIDDFVISLIPYALADTISVNAILFTIFQKLGIQKESYDLFYSWSEMLVRDFDELDKYLADPNKLFRVLLGEKEITSQFAYLEEDQIKTIQRFWSTFNPEKITHEQSLFLTLWRSLPEVYQQLNSELSISGRAYLGHAYRLLAENPTIYLNHRFSDNTHFIIAGFNRITPAELNIFSYLQKHFSVSFYWDVDSHYSEPVFHEAGYFYRKYSSRFPSVIPPQQNINSTNKKVFLYNCSKFVVQVQQTTQLIKEIKNNEESIAIILLDESKLPLVLAALAEKEAVNVTMGIQVRNSLTASFISQWIEMLRFVRIEGEQILYHITRLSNFINHPLLVSLQDEDTSDEWENTLKNKSENLISLNMLPNSWKLLKNLLTPPSDGLQLLKKLNKFFDEYIQVVLSEVKLNDKEQNEKHTNIQFELLVAFNNSLVQLINSCIDNKLEFTIQTASRLIKRLFRNSRIPFESTDTGRIQIMGLLESQCLDFDHVFILDFNEGSIPPGISEGSYIPYSIRKGFGLPIPDDHYRMYAYFFYRLLHRCQSMHLFYNSVAEGNISSEPSRYAIQIFSECKNIQVNELKQESQISTSQVLPIEIPKTPEIMQQLLRYTEEENNSYLTPSALNQYLDCRLRFYFRYIANLQEPLEISDEIDHAVFGNLLHEAMHTIYLQGIKTKGSSEFSKKDIEELTPYIPPAIHRAFNKVFHGKDSFEPFPFEGAKLIARSILMKYIEAILKYDEKCAPLSILRMEEKDVVTLHLAGKNIRIGGKIDRLDISKGIVRVIDYKSGSSSGKTSFTSIEQLFEFNNDNRPSYIFQVMLYAYIIDKLMNKDLPIQPGLLFVRDSFNEAFETNIVQKIGRGDPIIVNDYRLYKEEIKTGLNQLIADLYDPQVPFNQTENKNICKNCMYNKICRKED